MLVFEGCRNRVPQTGWLKTLEKYSVTLPRSRCWQGHFPTEASRGGSFLASFSFWYPRHSLVYSVSLQSQSLCKCLHMALFPPCFWLPIRIPVILDEGPTLPQYDLMLTNYICNDPISKWGRIISYWGLGLQRLFLEDTIQFILVILIYSYFPKKFFTLGLVQLQRKAKVLSDPRVLWPLDGLTE